MSLQAKQFITRYLAQKGTPTNSHWKRCYAELNKETCSPLAKYKNFEKVSFYPVDLDWYTSSPLTSVSAAASVSQITTATKVIFVTAEISGQPL